MVGIFGVLKMATRAMQVQQTGVEVAGNNISNVDNTSYSRQRIVVANNDPISTGVGPEGTGVKLIGIQQTRDELLDGQVRQEDSVGGYWTATETGLEDVQTELGEYLSGTSTTTSTSDTSSSMGLSTQINDLFSAFDALSTDTSSSSRQSLVDTAGTLANSFNLISNRLDNVNSNLNTSIQTDVNSANKLLSDIATLNDTILKSEASTGGQANDLRDLREQKLETLSGLMNVTVTHEANGNVTIANGTTTLVSGSNVADSLQTSTDANGNLTVGAASGASLTLTSGSIQGRIDTRDGSLATLRSNLDTLASNLITEVNTIYTPGYDLYGGTGATFFTGTDASTIGINSSLENDPSLVQAAGVPGASGDNSIALALSHLGSQPIAALGNQTFSDKYTQTVTTLANTLSHATDQVSNHNAVSSMLSTQRDSASGVSMEEELTDLMTYQTAYSAASHVISTVNDMLTTLMQI